MEVLCSPNTNDVELYIEENNFRSTPNKILHIVPTLILFKRRANFYQSVLRRKNVIVPSFHRESDRKISEYLMEHGIYLFELNRFYQYLIDNNSSTKVLKRRESLIVIERVLKESPQTNQHVWSATVSEIYDFFISLSITGAEIERITLHSYSDSWSQLFTIYNKYLEELKKLNCLDYGLACRAAILANDFSHFNKIYIDGAFLPFEPGLHKILIEINKKNKEKVKFFIPFDKKQAENPMFKVLKKTYLPYVSYEKWISINQRTQNHNVVQKLARSIFSDNKVKVDDNSFEIVEFETMEEEFSSIVSRIALLIKRGIAKQQKIAIVTPNPMEMRPYIRELAEIYGIQCDVPERPLIHLPIGKFIYLLFAIQIDNRINYFNGNNHYIDYDMMSDFLYINILDNSERISAIYEQLKAFFQDCITFDQWNTQINFLMSAKGKITDQYSFHPLQFITEEQLVQLKDYITNIKNLTEKIFESPNLPFKNHIEVLFKKLEMEKSIISLDDITRERIKQILDSVEQDNNILINIREFGTKIQSILKDDKRKVEEESPDQTKITVTGPNNVEFQEYDYIYLTRFSQNLYPEVVNYKWPMNLDIEFSLLKASTSLNLKNSRDLFFYYLDRSLYYLFIVLNSVSKKLTITYSKKENGIKLSISHYLHDIASVFGIEEGIDSEGKLEDLLIKSGLLINATSKMAIYNKDLSGEIFQELIKEDTVLTIEDIAVYDYCPRRFYYEKKYPQKKVYTEVFHIMNYGVACVYEEAVKLLVKKFPKISKENEKVISLEIDNIIKEVKEEIYDLFPLGYRYWEDIKLRTRFHLENLIRLILENTDHNGAEVSIQGQNVTKEISGYTFKGERELRVKYPTKTHYYSISNLKTLLSFSINVQEKDEKEYLQNVKKEYQDMLRGFCYNKQSAMHKLEKYAKKISDQVFDKTPGGHCMYCSFKQVCMEKEIMTHATN